ncbi:hypothetical protein OBBRIDRAFT_835799 [Obba rivulosa]|uniref:F-box domain-containing protein n=1 Tax=Obba rivulosa TaxID=1052685 RepID=A0A8E2DL43_9APHY|nr:hypothetical protein OBBRIDRAFT_835799 [Obba rivulosa]
MFQLPSRSDVLSMALTCRTVHAYAVEYLRFWRVYIDEATAGTLRDCLSLNFPSRFHFIRELTLVPLFDGRLSVFLNSPKTVDFAADIPKHARNLKSLKFASVRLYGSGMQDHLISVFGGVSFFEQLHIAKACADDLAMISKMNAPLSTLALKIFSYTTNSPTFPDLARFSSTLQVLDVSAHRAFFCPRATRCPKMHTLRLRDSVPLVLAHYTAILKHSRD